jgi:hypothetical protein
MSLFARQVTLIQSGQPVVVDLFSPGCEAGSVLRELARFWCHRTAAVRSDLRRNQRHLPRSFARPASGMSVKPGAGQRAARFVGSGMTSPSPRPAVPVITPLTNPSGQRGGSRQLLDRENL